MAKKNNKYNDLTIDELSKELQEKKEALFNMRFQKSLQQLDHPIMIRNRHNIGSKRGGIALIM